MRILHTADWHLGKIVNEFSMLDLQEEYLNQLCHDLERLEVDVLIMAGDLYDRAIPPKEAVALANRMFTKITQELNIPILAIAGNHDSNERIEYGSELLSAGNLFIEGTTKEVIRKVQMKGTNFYLLPYDDHRSVAQTLKDDSIRNPEDALRAQLATLEEDWDQEALNVLLYHGFVTNSAMGTDLEESESERPLSIGTVEFVPVELVERFDYVALGHLHKAQQVKHERIRYSGSPLKYSKSEALHKKQNILIELSKDGLKVEPIVITPSLDLRVVRGEFEELLNDSSEDYIFFELEDEIYVTDGMNRLRRNYPNAMGLEYVNHKQHDSLVHSHTREDFQKKRLDVLFGEFYEEHVGSPLNDEQASIVLDLFETIHQEEEK